MPAVLASFPALVVRTDLQGRVIAANRRWQDEFEADTLGQPVASYLDPSSQKRWERCLAGTLPCGQLVELVLVARQGAAPVSLFVFPDRDGPEGAMWLVENPATTAGFRFLTETTAVISELASLHRKLGLENQRVEAALKREQEANDRAQSALRERDQVLAFVAHDLKSPLAVIGLRAEHLLAVVPQEAGTDNTRHGLSVIRDSVKRMTRMIADLLDRSAFAAGKLHLRRQSLDGASLLHGVLAELGPKAASKAVQLAVEVAPGLPRIDGDADRLHRVLVNLLDNAIRVSPPRSTVTLRAAPGGGTVRFMIEDSGPGLDDEGMAKLFLPFAAVSPHPQQGSTGLGLSICKAIVEAHGGSVSACCRPGSGCTFAFEVPVMAGQGAIQTDGETAA